MPLKFGTSGVRGLVTEMTDRECYLYTLAFADYLSDRSAAGTVALAGDFRSSTPRVLRAVAAALSARRFQVDYCGLIPTPAVAAYAAARHLACVMVTGSHIPDDRNGIKFYMPWGETLKPDEAEISRRYATLAAAATDEGRFGADGMFVSAPAALGEANVAAGREFLQRYAGFFPRQALAGMRLVFYQHSAVARDMFPALLRMLGAEVVTVGWSDTFVPVDTEAVAEPERLKAWTLEHGAEALISADGDSDRPLLVDETGKVVRGDVLGIIVAGYLRADVVATPVSCNTAVEKSGRFGRVMRTRIGSPYVIAAMQEALAERSGAALAVVGYEANGGFLTGTDIANVDTGAVLPALPTRDCVLPIVAALCAARRGGRRVSELVADLPDRYTCSGLQRGFPSEVGQSVVAALKAGGSAAVAAYFGAVFGPLEAVDFTDGARMTFADGRIVHLRPSGNAPEFRCYTEAGSEAATAAANATALRMLVEHVRPSVEAELARQRAVKAQIEANLLVMQDASNGMDVIIVSTTSAHQASYWQARLEATRGEIARADALILAVHEDWPGGAGNGLGTLYALQAAAVRAMAQGVDLLARLRDGAAVGLYHTAGKGTRLAPLPAAEYNNKPGVRLPGLLRVGGEAQPMTILEAVIRQTAIYAAGRRGRVSVFWGDQVFVPSRDARYTPTHHADILARIGPMPDAAEWQARGLEKYGLIAVGEHGDAAQVEKVTHAAAAALIASGVISVAGGIGVSLGSFSLSAPLTEALLAEFADELSARSGKMDTDPHFWMPFTLDRNTYIEVMTAKGEAPAVAQAHYARMQKLRNSFMAAHPQLRLFGAVDVGVDGYWWDYGQIRFYVENNLKLVDGSEEAAAMRRFFGLDDAPFAGGGADVDAASVVIGCRLGGGRVRRSVLVGVTAATLDVADAVIVGCAAPAISGAEVLLYNVIEPVPVQLPAGGVRADVLLSAGEPLRFVTDRSRDGGADWHATLPGNPMSYDAVCRRNQSVDMTAAADAVRRRYAEVSERL